MSRYLSKDFVQARFHMFDYLIRGQTRRKSTLDENSSKILIEILENY